MVSDVNVDIHNNYCTKDAVSYFKAYAIWLTYNCINTQIHIKI